MSGEGEVASFMAITGASDTAAHRILDMCGGDVEQSVMLWYADEDLQRSLSTPDTSLPTASTTNAATSSARSRPSARQVAGREDAHGVIHIDSDDEDVAMTEDDVFDSDDDMAQAVARTAQEEEDAAIAQRLQDELYGGQAAGDEDGVRAPLARTTETLVAPSYNGGFEDDDMQAAMMQQLRRRQQAQARTHNPFAQSVWDDGAGPAAAAPDGTPTGFSNARANRLTEMFRPPYEIMSQFTWDEARDLGKEDKKWILVNLQDMSVFQCQILNRDIWKNEAISELVKENFIFLQYGKSSPVAEQYITFYFPNQSHENPSNYPHVSIIDPRTGEQVKVWSGDSFPSAPDFLIELSEFLDRYSLAANHKNPVPKTKRPERVIDVDRMTEEEMLEMAMKNSLETSGNAAPSNVADPDELTKSLSDISALDKGKGKAVVTDDEEPSEAAPSTPQPSLFHQIPSDRPHVEPPNDPSSTTRLQVRNPPSRIIRRFRLDDPVSRIYEWLKAEPIPGKEGVEFELKSMPQGTDLIEHLGETIKEAGLANGTVMIEFSEE